MTLNDDITPPQIIKRQCHYLGVYNDGQTWSATDQVQNYCHFSEEPQPVDWAYQCQFCFNENYAACKILNQQASGQSLSIGKRLRPKIHTLMISASLVCLIFLGVFFLSTGFGNLPNMALAAGSEPTQPTHTAALPEMVSLSSTIPVAVIPTQTATATPAPTNTPNPTATPTIPLTPTPGPLYKTPFGSQPVYLVHHVLPGENLELLANIYDTNTAVLRAVNGIKPGDILWAEVDLVVLPNVTDAQGVQARKPLYLQADTTVASLAETYHVSADQIRADNGLGSEEIIPGNRWLVIP